MMVPNDKLEECYRSWDQEICQRLPIQVMCDLRPEIERRMHPAPILGQYIAIDGKTIKNAIDKKQLLEEVPDCTPGQLEHARLHMVTAFNTELGLALGQVKTSAKSNEITIIPDFIRSLNIFEGDVITLDAMGTQTDIAEAILEKGAEYILPVKGNQKKLKKAIETAISGDILKMRKKRNDMVQTHEVSHGRSVSRTCFMSIEPACLGSVGLKWKGLKSFGIIDTETTIKKTGKVKKERCYFIQV